VIFLAVSEFLKKSGSTGPAIFFQAKKNLGFFFSREKKTGLEHAYSCGHVLVLGFLAGSQDKRDYGFIR